MLFDIELKELRLIQLLDVVGDDGGSMRWSILSFEGTGDLSALGTDIPTLIADIAQSDTGSTIQWQTLSVLAKSLFEISDITIAGTTTGRPFRTADDQVFYANCDIALELVDSSEWTIFVRDPLIAGRIEQSLRLEGWQPQQEPHPT